MKIYKITVALAAIFLLAAGCNKPAPNINTDSKASTNTVSANPEVPTNSNVHTNAKSNSNANSTTAAIAKDVVAPISRATERVTKKPFGIYITPKTSPVQPEKFTGYHSGVDFETFPEEKDVDVPFNAICDGTMAAVRSASGYGGVMTEYCTIKVNGAPQKVTVIYGHIRLSAAKVKAGQTVKAGQQLGVLGTGYSSETDGERKHLHLGIEKGQGSDIRGYVQQQSQLSSFFDITKLW